MIAKLKQTALGKSLYRLSRSRFGTPLAWLAGLLQHEILQPAHLHPGNRAHNQKQMDILARFEAQKRAAG
jgi:hypothetical protein